VGLHAVFERWRRHEGKLSNVLTNEMLLLTEPGMWEPIVEAVERAFDGIPRGDVAGEY
jgi:hypothetical protein